MPAFTVFLPYYNDEDFLEQSIKSILSNEFQDYELILLNHNSTDRSRSIAHSFNDDRIIHIDIDINYLAGGGVLFKKALSIAKGKYFKPFCADDIMTPDCLREIFKFMESHKNIDFAFTGVQHINLNGKIIHTPKIKKISSKETFFELLNERNFLCYPASVVKTDALRNISIDNSYILLFDLSLWVSLLVNNYKIGFLEGRHILYRIHDKQVSKNSAQVSRLYNMEIKSFWRLFTKINDVDVVKSFWPNSELVRKLNYPKDIPFVVSREMLVNKLYDGNSFVFLHDIMMNEREAISIEERFNYDLKSFRKDMLSFTTYDQKNNFKELTYNTSPKFLSLKSLAFLFLRKIFNNAKKLS